MVVFAPGAHRHAEMVFEKTREVAVAREAGAEGDFGEREVAVPEKITDEFHLDAEDFVADGMADSLTKENLCIASGAVKPGGDVRN